MVSEHYLGYVAPMLEGTEYYVAHKRIDNLLSQDYDVGEIALIWNQGNTRACSKGKNKYNVKFDSCKYKEKVIEKYKEL